MELESLFYYDAANGLDYEYYNSSRSYSPVFDIQPTAQQQQEARQVCTVDGVLNTACAYDYYATGNAYSSGITAVVNRQYVAAQNLLGLLASCPRYVPRPFYRISSNRSRRLTANTTELMVLYGTVVRCVIRDLLRYVLPFCRYVIPKVQRNEKCYTSKEQVNWVVLIEAESLTALF